MRPTIILKQPVPGISARTLERFAGRCLRAVGLGGMVTVLITGDRHMRQLNFRFRGKHRSTDVLSFVPPSETPGVAGDIAISLDTASRNARARGHAVSEEIRILVLHGILHLAGYDHERDDGEMAAREGELRRRLGLETGLIESSSAHRDRRIGQWA